MNEDNGVRFLFDSPEAKNFIYRPPNRWERIYFRLLHPIPYAKRGWFKLYHRIRSLFIKDRMVPGITRQWFSKEQLLKQYPEGSNNGTNQKQENSTQQNQGNTGERP